jgi:hypothetical protein
MPTPSPAHTVLAKPAYKILAAALERPLSRKAAAEALGRGGQAAAPQSADVYLRPLAQLGLLRVKGSAPRTFEITSAGRLLLAGENLSAAPAVADEEVCETLNRLQEGLEFVLSRAEPMRVKSRTGRPLPTLVPRASARSKSPAHRQVRAKG